MLENGFSLPVKGLFFSVNISLYMKQHSWYNINEALSFCAYFFKTYIRMAVIVSFLPGNIFVNMKELTYRNMLRVTDA